VISVVIPAYNESKVIARCLTTLLAGSEPGELEVVVVCNGCSDDTAERARKACKPEFSDRVRVIETPVGSKIGALNLGDENVSGFPRFYVDADIELTMPAIRAVAAQLAEESAVVVAAPRAIVDYEERSRLVRAFYRVWTRLPYFRESMIGSGVYAFSRQGRQRFGRFPAIIADDEFARLVASPEERVCVGSATFIIHPPRTLRGVLDINTRARAGLLELKAKFPQMLRHGNTRPTRTIGILARTPSLWLQAPVYLAVMSLASLRAKRKLRRTENDRWERDDTSRQ
jgi:glycosyltransferase involved in cell wall biosynthesis